MCECQGGGPETKDGMRQFAAPRQAPQDELGTGGTSGAGEADGSRHRGQQGSAFLELRVMCLQRYEVAMLACHLL
jgi:hypothetical protein